MPVQQRFIELIPHWCESESQCEGSPQGCPSYRDLAGAEELLVSVNYTRLGLAIGLSFVTDAPQPSCECSGSGPCGPPVAGVYISKGSVYRESRRASDRSAGESL